MLFDQHCQYGVLPNCDAVAPLVQLYCQPIATCERIVVGGGLFDERPAKRRDAISPGNTIYFTLLYGDSQQGDDVNCIDMPQRLSGTKAGDGHNSVAIACDRILANTLFIITATDQDQPVVDATGFAG